MQFAFIVCPSRGLSKYIATVTKQSTKTKSSNVNNQKCKEETDKNQKT